jgi:hypothetical protein
MPARTLNDFFAGFFLLAQKEIFAEMGTTILSSLLETAEGNWKN